MSEEAKASLMNTIRGLQRDPELRIYKKCKEDIAKFKLVISPEIVELYFLIGLLSEVVLFTSVKTAEEKHVTKTIETAYTRMLDSRSIGRYKEVKNLLTAIPKAHYHTRYKRLVNFIFNNR